MTDIRHRWHDDFDTWISLRTRRSCPIRNPYFEHLRERGPAVKEPHHGVMAVTGYARHARGVQGRRHLWSNCVAVGGPFPPLPFTPEGDDISAQIDAHRTQMPLHEHMVAMDPPQPHASARSLLSRLLTPSRLKANQDFLWDLADRQLDEFVDAGECEFLTAYSKPFSLLAIADLLGVPREDHAQFRRRVGEPAPDGKHRRRRRRDQPAGVPRREVQRLHRGAASRATRRRADRVGLGDLSGRLVCPRSPTSCARPPSCSVPARRRRPSCSVPHCGSCATVRTFSRRCVTTQARSPFSSRRPYGWRARSRPNSGWRAVDDVGGRRHSGGHDRDDLRRGRQPRSRPLRVPARIPAGPQERSRAGRLRPRRALLPRRTAGQSRGADITGADPGQDGRYHRRRATSTARRTTAATPTSRRSSCVA